MAIESPRSRCSPASATAPVKTKSHKPRSLDRGWYGTVASTPSRSVHKSASWRMAIEPSRPSAERIRFHSLSLSPAYRLIRITRYQTLCVRLDPNLDQMCPILAGRIHLTVCDTTASAHILDFAGFNHTAIAHAVTVRDVPLQHQRNNLHIHADAVQSPPAAQFDPHSRRGAVQSPPAQDRNVRQRKNYASHPASPFEYACAPAHA